jgi:regulator of sirC expression with transglutaminase-like and TPR domain
MPEESANGHGQSRLDRLEGLVEVLVNGHIEFEAEHKRLLIAQVVLTERIDIVNRNLDRLTLQVSELRESQKHTDERMNLKPNRTPRTELY